MRKIVTAAALTLVLAGCGSTTVTVRAGPAASPPVSSLTTAHIGCRYYAGGSAADPEPNVIITITAGARPVTGTLSQVTVGGPEAYTTTARDVSQVIGTGRAVISVAPGQTQVLGPFGTGDNSPLGNVIASVNCTVLSWRS